MPFWPLCCRKRSFLYQKRFALTCDQASLYFLSGGGGKVRLIQLLDHLSVASPESGLFFDWSRNKRYLELSHDWLPLWHCDFRSKKFRELINSIMASDEASAESEFLSALNASLASFVHKSLKDEQVECIRRIVCYGRDVLAVLPTGFGKSAIYQLIPKVFFHMGRMANATSKTTVAVVSPLDYIRKQQVASIEKMDCGICAAAIGESIQGDCEIEHGKFDIVFGSAEQWLSDRWRKALQFGALHHTKVLVVDEVHTVATW